MGAINIQFSNADSGINSGIGSGSSEFLVSILNKLNSTLDKLANIQAKNSEQTAQKSSDRDLTKANKAIENIANTYETSISNLTSKLSSTIGTSIAIGVGATALRILSNETTAVMSKATNAGNFVAQAIVGNANQAFG